MKNEIYRGHLELRNTWDAYDILFLNDAPISEQLMHLSNKIVTASFYISNEEKSLDMLLENHILTTSGCLDADYGDRHSEYTGYLWTDNELKIGNHDILEDLEQHVGMFLHLNIVIS